MALIKLADKNTDDPVVSKIFGQLERYFGDVADNFRLAAVSPSALKELQGRAYYLVMESGLNPDIFPAIRYAVASRENGEFCIKFNAGILRGMGISDDELKTLAGGGDLSKFSEAENELIDAAVKAALHPDCFTSEDVEKLTGYGFSERQIFDAVEHAANLVKMTRILKAFKI